MQGRGACDKTSNGELDVQEEKTNAVESAQVVMVATVGIGA